MSNSNFNNYLNPAPLHGQYTIADPGKRFLAYLLDFVLYFAVSAVAGIASVILGFLAVIPLIGWIFVILTVLVYIAAFAAAIWLQVRYWKNSTSFGKSIMKMKVVSKDAQADLSLGSMALREIIGKMVSGCICSLGYIWILIDPDKQGWHDKIVSSVVVVVE